MGKKDKAEGLSKKERAALEQREAALAAELAEREAKKAKKAAKRASRADVLRGIIADKSNPKADRKAAKLELAELVTVDLVAEAGTELAARVDEVLEATTVAMESVKTKTAIAAAATLAVAGNEETRAAAITAAAAADEAEHDESAEAIKARVKAKRVRRAELEDEAYRAGIDRTDAAAVKAYNEEAASLGIGHMLTSTAEVERHLAIVAAPVSDDDAEAHEEGDPLPAEQVVEPVETEEGTVYAAGAAEVDHEALDRLDDAVASLEADEADGMGASPESVAKVDASLEDFAAPSEAPKGDFERNGNGQYKVKRPSDGKVVGYTRATTYIDCLEDKRALHKWTKRLLLEGVAIHDTDGQTGDETLPEPVVSRVRTSSTSATSPSPRRASSTRRASSAWATSPPDRPGVGRIQEGAQPARRGARGARRPQREGDQGHRHPRTVRAL
jgi:hypothetical protein